jgi:integrase
MKPKTHDRRRSAAESVSKRNLSRLADSPGRYPVADAKGLFLKVKAPGKALWTYRYRLNGRETETSLGTYPGVTLDEARIAHGDKQQMVRRGADPLASKHAIAGAGVVAGSPTFAEMGEQYIEAARANWTSPRHLAQWRETIFVHCAPIAAMPVDAIDRKAVLAILEPMWTAKPETARRVCNRIETVLDYAFVRLGIEDERVNPARLKGRLDKVLLAKKPAAEHFEAVPYVDLPALMASLRDSTMLGAPALEFLVLTASRLSEATHAKWGEVDFGARVWTVPAARMKGKFGARREHRVPLCDRAIALLDARRAAPGANESPYVFPGMRPGRPISPWALTAALRATGSSATVHGFRSAFSTWARETTDFPREVVEAALAHAVGDQAERAYARGDVLEKRRRLMQMWADYCDGRATVADNVVAMANRTG